MDSRLHRACRAAAVVTLLALTVLTGMLASDSAAQETPQDFACAVAAGLTEDGLPRQARATIDRARIDATNACSREYRAATDRIAQSQAHLRTASEHHAEGRLALALEAAEEALEQDRELDDAARVRERAREGIEGATSRSQRWLRTYSSWSERTLAPLIELSVPLIGVIAALLLGARLLAPWTNRWPELSLRGRWWVLAFGLLFIVAAAGLSVFTPSGIIGDPWPPRMFVVFSLAVAVVGFVLLVWYGMVPLAAPILGVALVVVAVGVLFPFFLPGRGIHAWPRAMVIGLPAMLLASVGVGLTAWAVAKRLRLTVEVMDASGKSDSASTAHVVALLNELGAEPPKGLEVPRGLDSQALAGALKLLPEKTLGKAIASTVEWLFGLSPWKAIVEQESRDLVSADRRS